MNGSARHSSALPVAREVLVAAEGNSVLGRTHRSCAFICTRRPLCEGFTVVPLGQVLLSDALNVVGHLGRGNFVRSKLCARNRNRGQRDPLRWTWNPLDSLAFSFIH